jgi:hypothetical protein
LACIEYWEETVGEADGVCAELSADGRSFLDSRSVDTSLLRESLSPLPFCPNPLNPDSLFEELLDPIEQATRSEIERPLTVSIKSLTPSPALAKEHYIDLASRPFYAGLVKYITSGTPVVAM